ncbi:BglII/BstYI family type II restriction endonuclease [Deinococcus sp.]|uniref:BglII/BstYI family type II restriction endonuclease n=1 Tax=Deinococcus sp. TaxID=47478 RepID=UPI0025EC8AAE|nr:BglII/BstYI family type II restriction endonuclease [Deinococcus sp.]
MTDYNRLTDAILEEDSAVKKRLANVHVLKNEELADYVPAELLGRYEVYSFRHAAEILSTTCKLEFGELLTALRDFQITVADIRKPGGNESDIPKKMSDLLRPLGWKETRVQGDLLVRRMARTGKAKDEQTEDAYTLPNFIDGHNIDYVKNRVAFDMEWNSEGPDL